APGHPGDQKDISGAYWCLGDWPKAIRLMRGLVEGILDGSINYGDLAGGVEQGLLLCYMGVTANDADAASSPVGYMTNRAKRSAIEMWPGPLARYYLNEIGFSDVLKAATKQSDVLGATRVAQNHLMSRRRLCGALFHDGVKLRALG